jgi:hypothetical protein
VAGYSKNSRPFSNGDKEPKGLITSLINKDSQEGREGGSAAVGAARLCSAAGATDIGCANTDCALVPADVPAAWATVADLAAGPPGSVVCGGGVNGVTCEAVADWPA